MLKKISIDRLRPGMYVHELCADWMSHPFWRNQFLVKTREDVQRVREAGIRELYIDTGRGLDDAVARTASAKEYAGGKRLYGYVEGDLLYAFDMAAMGQPLQPHTHAQLKRQG